MGKINVVDYEFVEYIPEKLKDNTVYISIKYRTVTHKCCCGCGVEVNTPLAPTRWKLIFDGETVSLDPSIGNWSFACQSHYWIRGNRVKWARKWSPEEIAAGRQHDATENERYFKTPEIPPAPVARGSGVAPVDAKPVEGIWNRLKQRFKR